MPIDSPMPFPLLLPAPWWNRLKQVASACSTSPSEFVREVLEAEIVRRELLMEPTDGLDLSWFGEANVPGSAQLH
ncbi:MAG: hypothetical protein HYZ50_13320 [Deltaproteobacteria bacterium]|nr:hypothetical protein [Deltaproteobacteria bacterium]